jgi:hypothetical protein
MTFDVPLGIHLDYYAVVNTNVELLPKLGASYKTPILAVWIRLVVITGTKTILFHEILLGKSKIRPGKSHGSLLIRSITSLALADLSCRLRFLNGGFNISFQHNYAYPPSGVEESAARMLADEFLDLFYDFPVQAHGGGAHIHSIAREQLCILATSAVRRFNSVNEAIR